MLLISKSKIVGGVPNASSMRTGHATCARSVSQSSNVNRAQAPSHKCPDQALISLVNGLYSSSIV